jgi:hypothetical protein
MRLRLCTLILVVSVAGKVSEQNSKGKTQQSDSGGDGGQVLCFIILL